MWMAKLMRRAGLLLLTSCPVVALSAPVTLADCTPIADDRERLACFDALATGQQVRKDDVPARESNDDEALPDAVAVPGLPPARAADPSYLATHWELGPENKRGVLKFRQHQPNYLLATYTDTPNSAPYQRFRSLVPGSGNLSHAELAFQLGFKMKFLERPLNTPADLWFGYTQQSFWQAGNSEASSPFRETNYQPEMMAVVPLNFKLLGLQARFVNLGLLHQSNGQASTLSRSWNRVYAQLGMEKGDFMLVARVWQRLNEPASTDDNPDIVDYMGRGDLKGTYRWQEHEFSVLTRYNFHTNKGAAQLGWAYPLSDKVKGYVQYFSGYGHSLIDYNHSQNTLGIGVLVNY